VWGRGLVPPQHFVPYPQPTPNAKDRRPIARNQYRALCTASQCPQHFLRVSVRFHFVKHVGNLSVRADDKGSALYPHHLLAIHVLLFHDAESVGHLLVGVRKQGVGQVVLLLELFLPLRRIGGDAQNHGPGFLQLTVCVAEPARFDGSTGGVRLGKEEQHHGPAPKILQRHHLAVLVR